MASAPPQLSPRTSINDPALDPPQTLPRMKNAWSQVVRGSNSGGGDAESKPHPATEAPSRKPAAPASPSPRQVHHPLPRKEQLLSSDAPEPASSANSDSAASRPLPAIAPLVSEQGSPPQSSNRPPPAAATLLLAPSSPLAPCSPLPPEKTQPHESHPQDSKASISLQDHSEFNALAIGDQDSAAASGAASRDATDENAAKVTKPAWKKPAPSIGNSPDTGPVMGAMSWPALSDARGTRQSDTGKSAVVQRASPKSSQGNDNSLNQGSISKTSGLNGDLSGNAGPVTRQKQLARHSTVGNGVPALSSYESTIQTPAGTATLSANTEQLHQSVKSAESRMKGPLVNTDNSRAAHPRGDGATQFSSNSANRRNFVRDQVRGNHGWHSQGRGYANGRDSSLPLQHQRVGPRNLPRPPFISPNSNFIHFAGFQNAPGMYYMAAPTPDTMFGPAYFGPAGVQAVPIQGPDPMALQTMLIKQIEYYFRCGHKCFQLCNFLGVSRVIRLKNSGCFGPSVENLCRDIYLRSNMDNEGFVPISVIANFNRVRNLTHNPTFILEALHNSTVIEVQGDRLRKRDGWAEWILPANQKLSSDANGLSPTNQTEKKLEHQLPHISPRKAPSSTEPLQTDGGIVESSRSHGLNHDSEADHGDYQIPMSVHLDTNFSDKVKEEFSRRVEQGSTHRNLNDRSESKSGQENKY